MDTSFLNSYWFIYGLLPLMIFCSRIIDVSLDTLRIVFVSKGNKIVAPILGFFEVLIWLMAITRIMQNLDNPTCYFAYAGGFAAGNYVGLKIEEKLAMGVQMVRIITHKNSTPLINTLREEGFGVTVLDAEGKDGHVHIIYSVVNRNQISKVIQVIQSSNPNAFYSIEDVREVKTTGTLASAKSKNSIPRWMKKGR
ncbi:MAG: DUF2179 domain-containing protein [Deltaproteobacteria bacterium]|nr:DUF2179 domain-containing protein [Deltaproteobacteria bacterium]